MCDLEKLNLSTYKVVALKINLSQSNEDKTMNILNTQFFFQNLNTMIVYFLQMLIIENENNMVVKYVSFS